MKIIKRALINLVRMPIRNLLYFSVVCLMVLTVLVSLTLYREADEAAQAVEREYPIIATVLTRKVISGTGTLNNPGYQFNLDDLALLRQSPRVYAYEFVYDAYTLAEEEVLQTLPSKEMLEGEAAPVVGILRESVYAVTNLMMEQSFLDGTYRFVEGGPFTEEQMNRGDYAIVIPKSTADRYGLSVGEPLVIRPYGEAARYLEMEIVGIYEHASGGDVYDCYIPLETMIHDWGTYTFTAGFLNRDGKDYVRDHTRRIDFCLNSAEDAIPFVKEVLELDPARYEVVVNDKAYKTATAGLSQIRRVTLFLVIASLFAGAVIILSVTAWCRSTRVREAHILRCLGMKRGTVALMFALEMAIVLGLGALVGGICGVIGSDIAIDLVSREYIAEMEEQANAAEEQIYQGAYARVRTARSYPLAIRFGDEGEVPQPKEGFIPNRAQVPSEDEVWARYEEFYLNGTEDRVTVTGRTDIPAGDTYTEEMLRLEGAYRRNIVFDCRAGKDSDYEVGDTIPLAYTLAERAAFHSNVVAGQVHFSTFRPCTITLTVTELVEGDGIYLAMDELELISSFMGTSSATYRSVRYDERIDIGG